MITLSLHGVISHISNALTIRGAVSKQSQQEGVKFGSVGFKTRTDLCTNSRSGSISAGPLLGVIININDDSNNNIK